MNLALVTSLSRLAFVRKGLPVLTFMLGILLGTQSEAVRATTDAVVGTFVAIVRFVSLGQ